jgi:hypothetical protein
MILRTDQPGRLFAVFILAPYLVHTGFKYKDNTLVFIGYVFALYEIVWILYAEPKQLRKN